MNQTGCLLLILIAFIGLPITLVLFAISAPTTILFTIFASAITIYTRRDWQHLFIDSDTTSNNYTSNRKAEARQAEVEVITRMLLATLTLTAETPKVWLTIQSD